MFQSIGSIDVGVGEMTVVEINGTPVNLANADGRLVAFDDTCTHAGCSLADGDLEHTTVTCSCHGSQFDVSSGRVLRGPAARPVRSRAVVVDEGEVSVEV